MERVIRDALCQLAQFEKNQFLETLKQDRQLELDAVGMLPDSAAGVRADREGR